MIFCDVVNCRHNKTRECFSPEREALLHQHHGGDALHLRMACAYFSQE